MGHGFEQSEVEFFLDMAANECQRWLEVIISNFNSFFGLINLNERCSAVLWLGIISWPLQCYVAIQFFSMGAYSFII
uniref:PH domain-containing protein n=1 Tax=Ascaris lumbricoides TaxID=6252 RepID=A0A0M3IV28_ASCLU